MAWANPQAHAVIDVTNVTSTSHSLDSTPGVNSLIVTVSHTWKTGSTTHTVATSDNQGGGNTYYKRVDSWLNNSTATNSRLNVSDGLAATSSGTFTITLTSNVAGVDISYGLNVFTGNHTSAWYRSGSSDTTSTGNSDSPVGTMPASGTIGDLVFGGAANGSDAFTKDADYTLCQTAATGNPVGGEYRVLASAIADHAGWTITGDTWAASALCYIPAGGAPAWEPQVDAPEKIINIATPRWRS